MFHSLTKRLFFAALLFTNLASIGGLIADNEARGVKFKDPLILPEATAGEAYQVDLRTLLADPGVAPYEWKSGNLPAGLRIENQNNLLVGTLATAGTLKFNLSVKDSTPEGQDFNHPATLVVLPPKPKFKVTEINFGVTKEGDTLTDNLKNYLEDPSLATSLSVSGLPPWLKFDAATGGINGTPDWSPQHPFVGPYGGIVFTASNQAGSVTVPARGIVIKKLIMPKWTGNPLPLPEAFEEQSYSADTAGFVLNPEGMALKYEIVNMTPPPWLKIGAASGTVFGTPPKPGNVEVVVSFTTQDGTNFSESTTFKFKINHVNHPPKWLANPISLQKTTNGSLVNQPLANSAQDPDPGDTLTFSMTGPDWAQMDSKTGIFRGTPGKTNLGLNTFSARVTDQDGAADTTEIQIFVEKANEPPTWNAHPTILSEAAEDKNYTDVDLSKFVTDPDNDKPFFTKLEGPAWLNVTENGTTSGIPGAQDLGINKFRIKVSDRKSTPDDVAEVQIFVRHTNHAPYWVMNPIIFSVPEEKPVNLSVAAHAKDVDPNDTLTFSLIAGPQWASLDKNGNFTGTPQIPHEGPNSFRVAVADADGLTAETEVIINVLHVNHPPSWTKNPIVLANATEDADYTASILEFAVDPDLPKDNLRISKISSAPAWISVSEKGLVTGKPRKSDAGKTHSFQVRVMDDANAEAVTTVQVTVDKINHPPVWVANPIPLNDAYEDTTYTFGLTIFASDPDGDKLSFEKVDGPNWMMISKDGIITGVPGAADVGKDFSANFKVTDTGNLSATTRGVITVIHKNHPPVVGTLPNFTVKERDVAESILTEFVKDQDGDKINFTLLPTPGCGVWVNLSSDGKLFLDHPTRKDVGLHSCNFKVDDGKLMAPGVLKIEVLKNPRAPIWLSEPIANADGKTNEAFSYSVANLGKDLDGEKVKFAKQAGKEWLSLGEDGNVSGTPTDADLGSNEFTFRITNESGLFTDGTFIVKVVPGTQKDNFQVDNGKGPAELLWVVDNSKWCDSTIKALKKYINVFYNDLNEAQVNHANILLSTDVEKFKALPIKGTTEATLFGSSTDNLVTEFNKRVDNSASFGLCNNCRNSPLWSMFRFYEQLPTPKLANIYHNGYMMPGIPMDVLIVTHQLDHYKHYTSKLPEPLKSYTPNDFARDYIQFHRQEKKGLRVSAIAPGCPDLISSEPNSAGPNNSYNVVVQKTNGRYYVNKCNFNMEDTLHDYARDVVFRAKVHGNNPFTLSKTPKDVKSLRVKLGGMTINGNTGNAEDLWSYDAGTNSIKVMWYLIDTSQLKPGDQLEVEYRVSR